MSDIKYTDADIKILLNKLRDKRTRYRKRLDYESKQLSDIFEQTGLFDEQGKIVSVDEFKKKFGVHINYGVAMIQEKLQPNYVRDINRKYKDNIETMLNLMGLEEESEKEPYIITCSACSGDMYYKGSGRYCCEKCGKEYLTDFGKIKRYLEENGPTNAIIISNETGISRRTIGNFLKEKRLTYHS